MSRTTDASIRERMTTKILASVDLPESDLTGPLAELLSLAGQAPFHRACDESHRQGPLNAIEPWRFHVLHSAECRRLGKIIPRENAGKIPSMLSAADALLMATWLPNPSAEPPLNSQLFDPTLGNMEHIAAASAAIQNLLLAATARGISNYWSSGGILRTPETFELLGIPQTEILLGAIFLFPDEIGSAERVGSKLRDKRCPASTWSRTVSIFG